MILHHSRAPPTAVFNLHVTLNSFYSLTVNLIQLITKLINCQNHPQQLSVLSLKSVQSPCFSHLSPPSSTCAFLHPFFMVNQNSLSRTLSQHASSSVTTDRFYNKIQISIIDGLSATFLPLWLPAPLRFYQNKLILVIEAHYPYFRSLHTLLVLPGTWTYTSCILPPPLA